MKGIAVVGLVALMALPAVASSGTEGASFLDIPVGARPAAMGSAYTALTDDAYSPVWNPAGLGFLPETQIAAQHLSYLESFHYEFLSAVHPLAPGKSIGVSAQYLGTGDISGTDPQGQANGSYSSSYGAYSLAYGQKITDRFSVGLTGKWIHAALADVSANAFAADIGSLYQAADNLRIAATLTNLGSSLKFTSQGDSLPMAGHLAAAYRAGTHWHLVAEGIYDKTGLLSGRTGVEWMPMGLLSLRAGYRTDTTKNLSALAVFTTGIGITVWGQELAYAWVPYGDLGDTQYFSLLVRFGRANDIRNLIRHETINRHPKNPDGHDDDPEYQQIIQLLTGDNEHVAKKDAGQ